MIITEQLKGEKGKKVAELIERGVRLLHEQATLKEDLKQLAEDAKDEAGVKKAEFNKVVKAAFDVEVLQEKLEELGEVAEAIDVLKSKN